MWLTGNEKPVTLWTFFHDNRKALRRLMKLVKAAAKAGLVGFALHALDGTKLSAACVGDRPRARSGDEVGRSR